MNKSLPEMSISLPEMIDMVFDLRGETLPANYAFPLWDELSRRVTKLADHEHVAVLPLRAAENNQQLLLNRRTKLAIRIPVGLIDETSELSGAQLNIAGYELTLGEIKLRPIQFYPTLHAHLTPADGDEAEFLTAIRAHFAALQISANTICGIRHALGDGTQLINGFSLVVHDLKANDSIRLQSAGYGAAKRFGCGIFMPYKVISDLE